MTLIKCISLTALLSGAGTAVADSTDNVSSRLQVHVRDKNDLDFQLGNSEFHLDLYLAFISLSFCIFSSAVYVCYYSLWIDATCNRWGDVHRGVVQFWENERCRIIQKFTTIWGGNGALLIKYHNVHRTIAMNCFQRHRSINEMAKR